MIGPAEVPEIPNEVDVAVIGAGIAGLHAATRLVASGLRCLVLESRDRVGGRLLTHDIPARPLDLGATWSWPGEQHVADLVADLGVPTHPRHLSGDALFHVPAGARRIDGNPIDMTSSRFSEGARA